MFTYKFIIGILFVVAALAKNEWILNFDRTEKSVEIGYSWIFAYGAFILIF